MGGAQIKDGALPLLLMKRQDRGSTLRSRTVEYQSDLVSGLVEQKGLERLIAGVESQDSSTRLVIHKTYSWKDIKEAHDEMAANKNVGKIVITIDDE